MTQEGWFLAYKDFSGWVMFIFPTLVFSPLQKPGKNQVAQGGTPIVIRWFLNQSKYRYGDISIYHKP